MGATHTARRGHRADRAASPSPRPRFFHAPGWGKMRALRARLAPQPAINPGAAARALNKATATAPTPAAPAVRPVTDRFTVAAENIKPNERSPAEVAKSIGAFTNANLEVSVTKGGSFVFVITGTPDALSAAKRKIMDRIVKPVWSAAVAVRRCVSAGLAHAAHVRPPHARARPPPPPSSPPGRPV